MRERRRAPELEACHRLSVARLASLTRSASLGAERRALCSLCRYETTVNGWADALLVLINSSLASAATRAVVG